MNRRHFIFSVIAFVVGCQLLAAQMPHVCPLRVSGADKTLFGLAIIDLRTGRQVADVNSRELFVPASVTKALTVASVTSQLPETMKYSTECLVEGTLRDSVLHGNIVMRCEGDPTLESRHFPTTAGITDSIASRIAALGVKRVEGRVLYDYPYPLEEIVPSGWMKEDLNRPYGTGHHAFNFSDNLNGGRVVRDPQEFFSNRLRQSLSRRGITVKGEKIEIADPKKGLRRSVYRHFSPELSQIARSLMFRSDNMMAEATLRLLAPGRTRRSATQREMSLWEARGIDPSEQFVEDGSGLSRRNRISPLFLARVLEWMQTTPDARLYLSFFPRAGKEGTMRSTFVGTPLEGRAAFKTGSMNGVQCYAGYILDDDGSPRYVAVVMVNGFRCDRSKLKKEIANYITKILRLKNE